MIRLLAVDIDGTLLNSRGQLPDTHRDALVDAAAAGVEVALVTGRTFHFARPVAQLLPIPLTLIVNNGALVKRTDGTTEIRNLLSRDIARRVLAGTQAYEDSVALVFDPDPLPGGNVERQIVFERMDWSHPDRRGYYEKNKASIASVPSALADALTEDPVQVMFNGGVGPMRALVEALTSMPESDRFCVSITEYERRDFSLVDVNAQDCSKGTTLGRLAANRGWTRDTVMAVGDNLNDVAMLDFAGTAVVMGNATDALKARGYEVTRSNDEGGLADAVRKHVRQI